MLVNGERDLILFQINRHVRTLPIKLFSEFFLSYSSFYDVAYLVLANQSKRKITFQQYFVYAHSHKGIS